MRPRKGISPVWVTLATLAVLALAVYFFSLVFKYYRQIRLGGLGGLPQFRDQLSVAGKQEAGIRNQGAAAALATDDDPALGPKDAKLVIVEFVDYECPFCRRASGTVRALAARYGDRVRFIIRDIPLLDIHPNALVAAEAAGCAEAQGKFWPMHDRLFAEQEKGLDRPRLDALALQSGVDAAAFRACMDGHVRKSEIEEDLQAGIAAGVRGTPTFFFNGEKIEGLIPEEVFEKLIVAFLHE